MLNILNKKYKTITMSEGKVQLEQDKTIQLIDVRSKDEYHEGHIKNSKNIPLDSLDHILIDVPNKDTKLFVHCLSGMRSKSACSHLIKLGYTDVTNIGGINSWDGPIEY